MGNNPQNYETPNQEINFVADIFGCTNGDITNPTKLSHFVARCYLENLTALNSLETSTLSFNITQDQLSRNGGDLDDKVKQFRVRVRDDKTSNSKISITHMSNKGVPQGVKIEFTDPDIFYAPANYNAIKDKLAQPTNIQKLKNFTKKEKKEGLSVPKVVMNILAVASVSGLGVITQSNISRELLHDTGIKAVPQIPSVDVDQFTAKPFIDNANWVDGDGKRINYQESLDGLRKFNAAKKQK
jgi:hypothetical protein